MHTSAVSAMPRAVQGVIPPQLRLVKAAHEFEAQMMKELLKPMATTAGLTGSEDDSENGSNNALGEFAAEALGRALSERGGLGIAKSILRDLSRSGNASHPAPAKGNEYRNVGIRNPR